MKKSVLKKDKYEGYRVSVRLVREGSDSEAIELRNAKDVYEFIRDAVENSDRERFFAIYLDSKCRVLGVEEVSVGTVNMALFHPREMIKGAILSNAVGIIVVHNHPSGDPNPSMEDILITKKLKDASSLLEIKFNDHIIVGAGRYFSFSEKEIL